MPALPADAPDPRTGPGVPDRPGGAADLYARGLLARTDAIAGVTEHDGPDGRTIRVRVAGGLDLDVLPDRGFDIGRAAAGGWPLSWVSPVADPRPLDVPAGDAWLARFVGGLLVTCGPENIGPATGRAGLHGSHHHRPGRLLERCAGVRDGVPFARLAGTVEYASVFGPSARLERVVESSVQPGGAAVLRVVDDLHNDGPGAFPAALLYHLNLGAPILLPGTTVRWPGTRRVEREPCPAVPDPSIMPEPTEEITESVVAHHEPRVDADGFVRVVVTAPRGPAVELAWSADTLPHAYQWTLPTRRRWALGIEPASAPLFGPARSGPGAGAPLVPPGGVRRHELRITVDPADRPGWW
ncbi:DUF4432 family protein [Nakamurella sp.]|uniref:DUF4432 family protein n=1 Tax=Nakamurella sp. TaxID=1869182 RepID=UPI003B3B4D39